MTLFSRIVSKVAIPMLVSSHLLMGSSTAYSQDVVHVPELAQSEHNVTIPDFRAILRSIVPTSEADESASIEEILSRGRVEKWLGPVKMFFTFDGDEFGEKIDELVNGQIRSLLTSTSEATGLRFKRVFDLSEANLLLVFADTSLQGLALAKPDAVRPWFSAPADRYEAIREAFEGNESRCFRFIYAPEGKIERAISYISTHQSMSEIEKCLARNILFSVGLRGTAESMSAKVMGEDSQHIGLMDMIGLNLIYKRGVEPGMSLRDAIAMPK